MTHRSGWHLLFTALIVLTSSVAISAGLTFATPAPGGVHPDPASAAPLAVLHDNEVPAGRRISGTLTVRLTAMETDWRPMGEDESGALVYAFAADDGVPVIPSPFLRMERGTKVRLTLVNTLDSTLVVQGLTERVESEPEVIIVPPGGARDVTFTADAAGTYPYWGRVVGDPATAGLGNRDRDGKDALLSGVMVVDEPGAAPLQNEAVMILNLYRHEYGESGEQAVLQTINGRPWPHTRRYEYTQGDSVHWRLVNLADRSHPMHLHGFYFRVDAKGDLARDTTYWASQRRMAVTEDMSPGSTLRIAWSPDRPGGWLFHCHISFHVGPNPPLGDLPPDRIASLEALLLGDLHHAPDEHVMTGMGGLMVAVDVAPAPDWAPDERERRRMRALIVSDSTPAPPGTPMEFDSPHRRRFSLVIQDPTASTERSDVPFPGEAIVLRKDEPTTIWVVNRTPEPTAIHWHGLELESLYDGVVGVGGFMGSRTPPVMPGDSFQVRVTPPRAGSFMYHTHMSDIRQQGTGLYGPFVVLDDGEERDEDRDRVFLLGSGIHEGGVFMNGLKEGPPTAMVAGARYRLRFMNITLANAGLRVRVVRDGYPARWTPIAKDGADLPERWRVATTAEAGIRVGETMDFTFSPEPGRYHVEVRAGNGRLLASQAISVPEAPPVP
ncbi:MAG TPA: multicopper oxidase domain-containing protein [Longimicrobiales bacterium]|nr:multicopper oxidase domain-containing protein [Longimicrobiales bacterium]